MSMIIIAIIIVVVLCVIWVMAAPATSASPATAQSSKWDAVRTNTFGSREAWSAAIYDAIVGDPVGKRQPPYEGGVMHNTYWGGQFVPEGTDVLDQVHADRICENPCQWYPNQTAAAGLCVCGVANSDGSSTATAVGF